jgi:hypothetical protein
MKTAKLARLRHRPAATKNNEATPELSGINDTMTDPFPDATAKDNVPFRPVSVQIPKTTDTSTRTNTTEHSERDQKPRTAPAEPSVTATGPVDFLP